MLDLIAELIYATLSRWGRDKEVFETPEPDLQKCIACGYNLQGTIKALQDACPECGELLTDRQRVYWGYEMR